MNPSLPFRQVHLDFHTSEDIPSIAADFDPQVFAETLAGAHVNSINLFARCHHGWMYYDSQRFPDRVHPHLAKKNLLKEQIEACHARGIRAPIYITIQWDHHSANTHPEWLTLGADGKPISFNGPLEAGFYRYLCVNSPYRDFIKAHTQEVLETLPVDGLWFDIVQPVECICQHCRKQMIEQGLEPSDAAHRRAFALRSINAFKRDLTAFVRQFNPDCLIFYNAGHIGPRHRAVADAYTHFELESLPSGGWGYIHFPLTMRYARSLGLECIGMTGKFHTAWGDFHSYKNPAALQYEVFNMLALAAKCCVGDQLHPSGAISQPTYDLIGSVYAEVEAKEPWCVDALPLTDIGVLTPEEFHGGSLSDLPPALIGAVRMLTECGFQFDVLDSFSDFERYKLLILPDVIPVEGDLAGKLKTYLAHGGHLLLSYRSGLDPATEQFALPEFGVRSLGEAPYSPDFLVPSAALGQGLPAAEHVMYQKGLKVEALPGSLAWLRSRSPTSTALTNIFAHTATRLPVGWLAIRASCSMGIAQNAAAGKITASFILPTLSLPNIMKTLRCGVKSCCATPWKSCSPRLFCGAAGPAPCKSPSTPSRRTTAISFTCCITSRSGAGRPSTLSKMSSRCIKSPFRCGSTKKCAPLTSSPRGSPFPSPARPAVSN